MTGRTVILADPASLVRVDVANEAKAPIAEEAVSQAVSSVLAAGGRPPAHVSVAIVDDATIRLLNRRYLEHDWATDVITFVLEDSAEILEGEIVVSWETAVRTAAEVGWPPESELTLYLVHGALHLAGHDDRAPEDAVEMRLAERRFLDQLGVEISPRDDRWPAATPDVGGRP
jgi:probable rRNA maturation factor